MVRLLHGTGLERQAAVRGLLFQAKGIVVLRSPHGSCLKPGADLESLHRADGEYGLCQIGVQLLKHGLSDTDRHPLDDALHHAA